jgi:hypothetical protein
MWTWYKALVRQWRFAEGVRVVIGISRRRRSLYIVDIVAAATVTSNMDLSNNGVWHYRHG